MSISWSSKKRQLTGNIIITIILVVVVIVVGVVDTGSPSNHQTVPQNPQFFNTFDFQMCFSQQRRALFRHRIAIESSKSGPNVWCFATFYFEMCLTPQRRAFFRHRNVQKWSERGVFCTFLLPNVLRATTPCTFFDIVTSKSDPELTCFVHFHFEMCFAPQRRALFPHRNFQKSSEPDVFCHF